MTPSPKYHHRWLLLAPFAWQIGAVPLVDDIDWRLFGLPFAMTWQLAGIVLTSIVIAIVFHLDEATEAAGAAGAQNSEPET